MKSTHSHGTVSLLLFLLFLFLSLSPAAAQPSPDPDNMYACSEVPLAVPITILVTGLFVVFFAIYVLRDFLQACLHPARGLDASAIEALPTFSYSEAKDRKIGKGAPECAVCLDEFEDKETLRLLPKCNHVFHPACIDLWLASHATCPVCRANLAQQTGPDPVQPEEAREQSDQSRDDEIVIQVDEDDHPQPSDRIETPNRPAGSKVVVDRALAGPTGRESRPVYTDGPNIIGLVYICSSEEQFRV